MSGGVLPFIPPGGVVGEVVELGGGYVVPPYGEGHPQWLEPERAAAYVAEHLRAGVQYVRDHATSPTFRTAYADLHASWVCTPRTVTPTAGTLTPGSGASVVLDGGPALRIHRHVPHPLALRDGTPSATGRRSSRRRNVLTGIQFLT